MERLETGGSLLLTDPSGDFLTAAAVAVLGRKILVPILVADGTEDEA